MIFNIIIQLAIAIIVPDSYIDGFEKGNFRDIAAIDWLLEREVIIPESGH